MQAIKDIMTSQFPAIYAHTELTDIIEQLQSHGLFGAPVVDAQKQLIGKKIELTYNYIHLSEDIEHLNDILNKKSVFSKFLTQFPFFDKSHSIILILSFTWDKISFDVLDTILTLACSSRSRSTTYEPTNPFPPVTKTFLLL